VLHRPVRDQTKSRQYIIEIFIVLTWWGVGVGCNKLSAASKIQKTDEFSDYSHRHRAI